MAGGDHQIAALALPDLDSERAAAHLPDRGAAVIGLDWPPESAQRIHWIRRHPSAPAIGANGRWSMLRRGGQACPVASNDRRSAGTSGVTPVMAEYPGVGLDRAR